jgi:DNA/RNA-binding domain of Phe-tRNA-synthetase-like protein
MASPGGALVSAMFAAELSNLLLTAGHDVGALVPPLVADCSRAGDRFVGINGQERELKPGDMLMRDGLGIISAVLNGPDERTRLSESTTEVLFVTYAPVGISPDEVRGHLDQIAAYVRLTDPRADVVDTVIL